MTKEELVYDIRRLKRECEIKCESMCKHYAMERNIVKVGDVVAHTILGTKYHIKVQSINVWFVGSQTPECIYKGQFCDKDGNVIEGSRKEEWFQTSIEEINGNPYKYVKE